LLVHVLHFLLPGQMTDQKLISRMGSLIIMECARNTSRRMTVQKLDLGVASLMA
jgi:hypothetical protein